MSDLRWLLGAGVVVAVIWALAWPRDEGRTRLEGSLRRLAINDGFGPACLFEIFGTLGGLALIVWLAVWLCGG
jgi:hypothetical protein